MPRRPIKDKIPINKLHFYSVLDEKNTSVKELCENYPICHEKTLRRNVDSGMIRSKYAEKIADLLNITVGYLTGDHIPNMTYISRRELILKSVGEAKMRLIRYFEEKKNEIYSKDGRYKADDKSLMATIFRDAQYQKLRDYFYREYEKLNKIELIEIEFTGELICEN